MAAEDQERPEDRCPCARACEDGCHGRGERGWAARAGRGRVEGRRCAGRRCRGARGGGGRLLAGRGAAVIDAERLARQAPEGPVVLAAIARELGEGLVLRGPEGPRLDRAATAARVFGDPEALARLNGIVHPWVRRRAAE